MYNPPNPINLVNSAAVQIATSTAPMYGTPLAVSGVYGVWSTAAVFIGVSNIGSTTLTTATGFPILASAAPVAVNIPAGYALGGVAVSGTPNVSFTRIG